MGKSIVSPAVAEKVVELNSKFVINSFNVEGTTDTNGNIVATGYGSYLHKVTNALPVRTSPFYTSAYICTISTTSDMDYLIIHASNPDGSPLTSQNIKVRVNYLNFAT